MINSDSTETFKDSMIWFKQYFEGINESGKMFYPLINAGKIYIWVSKLEPSI